MVDFTQPINNADMVQGLNKLIHRNINLMACYQHGLMDAVDEQVHRDGIEEFKNLHEQHAHLLGDTVRILGGAPDYREDRSSWISKSKMLLGKLRHDNGILSAMHSEEKKLEAEYLDSIRALKASPESVAVINQALEEREKPMLWLHQATEGGKTWTAS